MKNITTACLILFTVSLFSDHVLAAEAILLRTAVTPEKVWVGQKVLLHVDVLAKNGWAQIKKVSDAEVDGAYLLRLETQGTRLSETIEGDRYTGQRYEFMLFPQRDGTLTVPSVPVDVEIKTWGAGGGTRTERMWLPLVEFVTRTPPGAEGLSGLISTTDLTANQNWDPETESPMVGDAIKRTISLRAKDVAGRQHIAIAADQHAGRLPAVDENRHRGGMPLGERRLGLLQIGLRDLGAAHRLTSGRQEAVDRGGIRVERLDIDWVGGRGHEGSVERSLAELALDA